MSVEMLESEQPDTANFIAAIANHLPGHLAYWTSDLHCTFVNRRQPAEYGLATANPDGASAGFEDERLFAATEARVAAVLRGEDQNFEHTETGADGRPVCRWVQYIARRADGEVKGFFVLSFDMTRFRSDQDRMRINDVVLAAVSQGVLITDVEQRILSVNGAFASITGYSQAEAVGRRPDFLQGPRTDPEQVAALLESLSEGAEFHGEILNYRKDGTPFWNELSIVPARDAAGTITHFVGVCRDATERVDAREILVQREALSRKKSDELGMVLSSMNQGIECFDSNMRLTVWNRQYAEMFGLDIFAIHTGMTLLELLELQRAGGNLDGSPHELWTSLLAEFSLGREFSSVSTLPSGRIIRTMHSPGPDGGWIGTHEDVTEQHRQAQMLADTSRQLTTALSSMRQGLSLFDAEGCLLRWNEKYLTLYRLRPDQLRVGMPFRDLLMARQRVGTFAGTIQTVIRTQQECFERGEHYTSDTTLPDGRTISTVAALTPDGGWVSTHEDITEVRQQQSQMALQNVRFAAALNNMSHGLCMFDKDQLLVTCNAAYAELYRLPPGLTLPGTPISVIFTCREGNGTLPVGGRKQLDQNGDLLAHGLYPDHSVIEMEDGRLIRILQRYMPDGGWVSTHEDITEQRRIEARIEHDALHDSLTGLPNRRLLDRVLADRQAACRASGAGVAVLHIDLDRFKQINDTLGHEAGDAMLVHAAQVLRSNLRDNDFVSRVGGDEFVVVCDTRQGPKALAGLAARIVAHMQRPVPYHGHECRFGVSIGIAHQAGEKVDAKKLLINADIALYQAKTNGRGSHAFFTPAMQLAITRTKRLADEIQSGVENGEFIAYYQPQVDARTLAISGVEALVRWQHPKRGVLTPDKFLGIADELGLVATIDRMVLEQTLQSFNQWRGQGLRVPRASVNVSARRLRDANLIKSLRQFAIEPNTLSFELLESIYLDETDDLVSWNIEQIRELGIEIEVDDFGSGHTSILSLLKLRPQRLKIDRQLVAPIVNSVGQQQLLRSIVEIGHSLGIKVIAEGVETMEHASIAGQLGCDELQGYAFSRPLSATDFVRFAASLEEKAA